MTIRSIRRPAFAIAASCLLFVGYNSARSSVVWASSPPAETGSVAATCPVGMIVIGWNKSMPPQPICVSQTSVETGEIVFKRECQPCHGPRGQSSMPGMNKDAANLASDNIQSKSDDELRKTIRKGKKGSMEMVGHPWLTKEEVNSLVLYIRSLKP